MSQWIKEIWHASVQVIYPETCCLCQADLVSGEQHICASCSFDLPYIMPNPSEVTRLNKLFWGRVEVQRVYALLAYQKGNQVQRILHHIKYQSKPQTATHFGKWLASYIPPDHGVDAIVPVPLHPKKERERGFNQSLAIAQGLEQGLQIPILSKNLTRNANNKSQTGFSKYDRYDNVRSIFSVREPERLEGKHVLLVDDVLTTGATIESCAAELLEIKDTKVSIATLAARI